MTRREARRQEIQKEGERLAAFYAEPTENLIVDEQTYDALYDAYTKAFRALNEARQTGIDLNHAQAAFETAYNALVDREERREKYRR